MTNFQQCPNHTLEDQIYTRTINAHGATKKKYTSSKTTLEKQFWNNISAPSSTNDTATTEIYTLSLHEFPISVVAVSLDRKAPSELQSHSHLVCRLLLEKKTI